MKTVYIIVAALVVAALAFVFAASIGLAAPGSFRAPEAPQVPPAQADSAGLAEALRDLPFTMPEIREPSFPEKTVSIADHGAVPDGRTLNTAAFASAIGECAEAGGGTVLVPAGEWLTGAIRLESNIRLHLDGGAVVMFSRKFEDYPLIAGMDGKSKRFMVPPPVHAFRAKNIAITGRGTFDGGGSAWWYVKKEKRTGEEWDALVKSGGVVTPDGRQWWPSAQAMNGEAYLDSLGKAGGRPTATDYAKAREFLRPDMVRLVQCDGVLIDGPTFRYSPRFHVHPVQSENIIVRNVTIRTEWWAQNGDGLDLSACRNAVVYNTTVDVGDDAICVKPARISERQSPGPACENIVIANCTVYRGHGGFVIGSESFGGARNISVKNCTFTGTDVGLRFKSNRGRGGTVERVFISGITMKDIRREAVLFDMYYDQGDPEKLAASGLHSIPFIPAGETTPRFGGIAISNVSCDGARRAILLNGLPEMPLRDIVMDTVSISAERGALLVNTEGIVLRDVRLETREGPIVSLDQSARAEITRMTFPRTEEALVVVRGEKSTGIVVSGTDVRNAAKGIVRGEGAPQESVTVRE
jgi:polygalacturonase